MPNLSSNCVTRPFYALAIASCIVGVTPPLIAGKSEARFEAQLAQRAGKLEAGLIGQEFSAEIAGLVAMPDEGLVERFASFRPHASDASRLNYKTQLIAPPEDAATLTRGTVSLMKAVLKTPEHLSGSSLRSTLLIRIPREKAWRVLESLEIEQDFDAAAGFSKLLLDTESNQSKRELLALVAARNAWLQNPEESTTATSLIIVAEAIESQNETIAAHAALWAEALQAPRSVEALNLAVQLWEVVRLDKGFREPGAMMSNHIEAHLDATLSAVQASELDQPTKETQIARIASIGAEMGFQHTNAPRIEWARGLVTGLSHGNQEDLLAPDYFLACDQQARGRDLAATTTAEAVFFNGLESDITADAGRILAECLMRLDDDMGALATYELLRELYPNQSFVLQQIENLESHLKDKFKSESNLVQALIEEKYGEHRKKIFAARAKHRNLEQANLKPEAKKVASK